MPLERGREVEGEREREGGRWREREREREREGGREVEVERERVCVCVYPTEDGVDAVFLSRDSPEKSAAGSPHRRAVVSLL